MKTTLIGRAKERSVLQSCMRSGKPEFVAVYGRRRVGKTFLVRELLGQDFVFYVSGILNADRQTQIQNFNAELAERGAAFPPADNWMDAFSNLAQWIRTQGRDGKKVIFLDEIPWMDSPHSGFIPALDHFWNRHVSTMKDVLLIICGSATSWIIDKIVDDKAGLHNRLTRQIHLAPFTLGECEAFYQQAGIAMTRYQMAEAYMIFGGIPYYLSLMEPRFSLYQNVDAMYFAQGAELRGEYDNLYRALFKNAEGHMRIVGALASNGRGLTRAEIVATAKLSEGGRLSGTLEELSGSGFIRAYRSYGRKQRDKLYQLTDAFTLFHHRFAGKRDAYNENYWLQFSATPAHNAWSGYAFEQVCLQHIRQIQQRLGISG
ncbi:MAG: AAA family ATPase, partial [Clostridiales Family XIII bacterium]|nr:AAA family ATPase [Clostridiales Family XIII bacterium]